MTIVSRIKEATAAAIEASFGHQVQATDVLVNETKPEFEGDYTVVLFAYVKILKAAPDALGQTLGQYLVANNPELFTGFNVIKGFLNLSISDQVFLDHLGGQYTTMPSLASGKGEKIMVEYSSPNTNKPLHLGHLRNIFLGWSIAEISKALGNEVMKTCIVNDRGIHICKSMIAWEQFANGATPESTGAKGDHFVGDYYVKFSDALKAQTKELEATGLPKDEAERKSPLMQQTQQMLVDWEAGKPEVMELWQRMNSWVYAGFDETYKRIGADFDKVYYESQTYLLGRQFVEQGLESGVFYRKDDGSVWIDLTSEGLDEKLVLRKDGTSVYITQDMGLAQQKYDEFAYDQSIYVIADEQNYHMKVLQLILKKMGKPYADGIFHLSYGMVELPSGRMKSREGTVVDADDLVAEMVAIAAKHTHESGKVQDFTEAELAELYHTIGLGALKFFLLRVDPKKKMIFNPEESIDFHGFTGPFIQYTHARIKSILRRQPVDESAQVTFNGLEKLEKNLLVLLEQYPTVVAQAAAEHNPSVIALYAFNVAKTYNTFYTEHSVLNAESDEKKQLRLRLCQLTANTIKSAMGLLGIRVPERM
ncbi:arginine--tRNA ligase [Pseudocnuella soli]|uniref:arginine--tRNA ligase n=1 Tax=Pseudocnuella soli TaxID=2502779 RepID=UPI0010523E0B|nr:arginine--tRNA ligase [Pseudocnuella soli]